jgi:hypothetical protein
MWKEPMLAAFKVKISDDHIALNMSCQVGGANTICPAPSIASCLRDPPYLRFLVMLGTKTTALLAQMSRFARSWNCPVVETGAAR